MSEERRQLLHDIANALTIARSSIEPLIDGIAPITKDRLEVAITALNRADELVEKLRHLG